MLEKVYRPNVAAIILSPKYPEDCQVFIANRKDIKKSWQFPQGGIDKGESPKDALFRELKEEIGTNDVRILGEYPKWISYDFPSHILHTSKYKGQTQRYFLVKLNSLESINIHTQKPEFIDYRFVPINKVFDYTIHFKTPVYKKVLSYFKKEGFFK